MSKLLTSIKLLVFFLKYFLKLNLAEYVKFIPLFGIVINKGIKKWNIYCRNFYEISLNSLQQIEIKLKLILD